MHEVVDQAMQLVFLKVITFCVHKFFKVQSLSKPICGVVNMFLVIVNV